MKSTYLVSGLVALFQLHAADAVLEAPLPRHSSVKEPPSRERSKRLTSGLKLNTARSGARIEFAEPRSGAADCGSASFLDARRYPVLTNAQTPYCQLEVCVAAYFKAVGGT